MTEPIYCFELQDVKFCHLRLSRIEVTDELVKEIGPVDVLMLPVGNPPVKADVSSALQAWAAVGRLNAKMVLPMRYQTEKTKPELGLEPIDPFREVASKAETDGRKEAFVLGGGHSMRISTSNLPQGPMRIVYVLKPW
jgi:L-ascorbate metabolism protein UlaG (beta-lactamase superfamily)